MFKRCIKILLVVSIACLSPVNSVFAAAQKQAKTTERYNNDASSASSFQDFKKQRDVETERIRQEIFTLHPGLQDDPGEMTKKVTDRKIKIIRERHFLDSEFEQGIAELYQKGVNRFVQKEYAACRLDFEEVAKLSPGFKDTQEYLKKLEKISQSHKSKPDNVVLNTSSAIRKGKNK